MQPFETNESSLYQCSPLVSLYIHSWLVEVESALEREGKEKGNVGNGPIKGIKGKGVQPPMSLKSQDLPM